MKKSRFIFLGIVAIAAVAWILNTYQSPEVLGTVQAGANEDNPGERNAWLLERLKDPATGEIPAGIRHKELEFAKKLPNDKGNRNLDWLARGPYNIGGRTRALAYDVENPNRLIAGGTTGAIYLSEDGGASWVRRTTPDHFPSVSCIAQDTRPGKTNTWYYGTGELRGGYVVSGFFYGDGIYKSTDNGLTWSVLESTQFNQPENFDNEFNFVNRIVTDPSVDSLDLVYAATYGGIRRSDDGGETWTKVLGQTSPTTYYCEVAITEDGVLYGTLDSDAAQKGIWRSEDGINWVNITPTDTFPMVYERMVIAVNPSNNNEVYFFAKTPGAGAHSEAFFGYEDDNSLWKYTYLSGDGSDAGGQWENLSANLPTNSTAVFDNLYTQSNYNMMLAVSPHDPNTILIGATNLYRSTDGFTSPNNTTQIGGYWVGSSLPSGSWGSYLHHHPDQHLAVFHPIDTLLVYSANDGGIYYTSNVYDSIVSWTTMNNGYNTTQAYTVGFDLTEEDEIIIGGFQDNANYFVNSEDTTAPWTMPLNGDGSYMGIAPGKDFYVLSINRGKIYKMDLDGDGQVLGFKRIDPDDVDPDNYLFINPLIMDPNDEDIIYVAAGKKLYRNNQVGSLPLDGSHDTISTGWYTYPFEAAGNVKISCIDVSVEPEHTVWFGTSARQLFKMENAHQNTPTVTNMPIIQFPAAYISRVAVHPHKSDTVIVTFSNYSVISLFYTVDGGASWIKGAGNLEENAYGSGSGPSVGCVDILPREDGDLYFVGTTVGAFATYKLDSMNTVWTQIGTEEFGNSIVEDIKVRELDGLVAIGTYGKGIYTTHIDYAADLFPIIGIEEQENTDISFNLYPNPATNVIHLQIDESISTGKVEILDIQGRVWIGNDIQESKTIDISQLAKGTYYCRISTQKGISTKAFVKQ